MLFLALEARRLGNSENGAPRKWYRQKSNLRVMGYIDNERQLEYIKDDIQNALSLEVTEYQLNS